MDRTLTIDLEKACIQEVITIGEVMEYWGKARNTVIYAILRGNIVARQTPGRKGTYLVSKQSVISMWGKPLKEMEFYK